MRVFTSKLCIVLVLQLYSIAAAVQIGRILPPPTDNAALKHRHNAYIDQRMREDPHNLLNHQAWHQRNIMMTPTDPSLFLDSSNTTDTGNAASSVPNPQDTSVSPPSALKESLPQALGMTTAIEKQDDSLTLDQTTEVACVLAVSGMNGVASNPSGMAACYNIQSVNNITGTFNTNLRIYQVCGPKGDWLEISGSSVSLGLDYARAIVTKHDEIEETRNANASLMSTHGSEVIRSRSNRTPPHKFASLALTGHLVPGVLEGLQNE